MFGLFPFGRGYYGQSTENVSGGSSLYTQTLSAVSTGVATLTKVITAARTLSVSSTGVATLSKLSSFFRALSVAATGSTTLAAVRFYFKTLSATASNSATLTKALIYAKALSATAVGVTTLSLAKFYYRTLSATASNSATLTRIVTIFKTLSATSVGVATMTAGKIFFKTLSATASNAATLLRQFIYGRTLSVTSSNTATMTRVPVIQRALSAVSTGVATLSKISKYFLGSSITISNYNFEVGAIGAVPTDWETYDSVGTVTKELVADTIEGSQAFRLYSASTLIDGGIWTANAKRFFLKNNTSYNMKYWYKTDANVTNATIVVRMQSGNTVQGQVHYSGSSGGWKRGSFSFTTTGEVAGKNNEILVGLGSYGSTSKGEFLVDDLMLTESAFSVSTTGVTTLTKSLVKIVALSVIALGVATISIFKSFQKTLVATASNVVELKRSLGILLSATATGVVTMLTSIFYQFVRPFITLISRYPTGATIRKYATAVTTLFAKSDAVVRKGNTSVEVKLSKKDSSIYQK